MSSELTTTTSVVAVIDHKSTAICDLVEVRLDPQRFPRVKATEPSKAIDNLRELVVAAILFRGLEQDQATVDFIAANLYGCMAQEGRDVGMLNLSWYEVARVIRRASLDGSLIGVSVSSLYGLLRDYCLNDGHDADKNAQDIRAERRARKLTPGQQAYIDAMEGAFEKAHKVGGPKR